MGTATRGGTGCKERAGGSGERPIGAARCRQQYNRAPCQTPSLPHGVRKQWPGSKHRWHRSPNGKSNSPHGSSLHLIPRGDLEYCEVSGPALLGLSQKEKKIGDSFSRDGPILNALGFGVCGSACWAVSGACCCLSWGAT